MATVLLGAAGGAIGGAIGGPIGAMAGRALGAMAGGWVDQQIVNALTPPTRREGPRLTSSDIQTATEGSPIDRCWGRARLSGQIIWATRFVETVVTEQSGGKGAPAPSVITTTYAYAGNFAVGLCEGPVSGFGRIWADGIELDQTKYTIRAYRGSDSQEVDPLIEAKEGNAPAYRGLAYVVFDNMPLEAWGNRLPQIAVEVFRAGGALEPLVQGTAIIGTNEFGCDTEAVTVINGGIENRHTLLAPTDWTASIDRLQDLAPQLGSVMLVLPWFGDDLRAGHCSVRPKVDAAGKNTTPFGWRVSGVERDGALVVSYVNDKAAFGGSPNDASTIRAILDLKARGLAVTLCPFLMMDIAAGNSLPDPYSDNAASLGQPIYPWRGRISCSPAPGFVGSPDKTAATSAQIASFMGTASAAHFSGSGTTVTYSGPDQWQYRRMVLHCAQLAQLAGGVEAFLIGSEMVGLTQVRSSASSYPFVTALKALAGEARAIVGGDTKIGYAADWSEFNSHRPTDGTGDVYFHLDPLWSDANIDFVGIDNYMPLADWRDGAAHLDFDPNGPTTIYDPDYLAGNVEGGEYYDWFYADLTARQNQTRTPIADGAHGKPWVFRQKDIRAWWSNPHHNRPGGVEGGAATAWVPQSKPIRFTEYGCPAVDKGANQPNVFVDPKSSESFYPWFSSQARDDGMQRAYCRALLRYYAQPSHNPTSAVYGKPMLDLAHSNLWSWDARPWPSFPLDTSWGDAANWYTGHWITGRLGAAPAADTIASILDDAGFTQASIEPIPTVVDGITAGTLTSARTMLDALRPAFQFDATESDGVIKFLARLGRAPVAKLSADALVAQEGVPSWRQTRGQETELPDAFRLRYGDPARDDQPAATGARRSAGGSRRTLEISLPVIMAEPQATALCERELYSAWLGRDRARFVLPPSLLALDAGDVVDFGPTRQLQRLETVEDGYGRSASAFAVDPQAGSPLARAGSAGPVVTPVIYSQAVVALIDGPLLSDSDADHAGYLAGTISPFRSGMVAYRSPVETGFVLDTVLPLAATIGQTTGDLYSGPTGRWDRVTSLYLELTRGALYSADELQVLNGANAMLVENQDGEWELLQFATATANGATSYILTNLLRGQRGTEHAMRSPVPSGARLVLVNAAVRQTSIDPALVGVAQNWKVGPIGEDLASPRFETFTVTMTARARRPLAPSHLRGKRDPVTGDWTLSWMRRTRLGGDSWDQIEVPLAEVSESYALDILDGPGGSVLRSFATVVPTQAYSAAQQTADFGAPQYSFWARIAQVSASYGAGIPTQALVWIV